MPLVFLCWLVTLGAAGFAALLATSALHNATGAPQQAAGAAIALAVAIIPYVFTRALEGMVLIVSRKEARQRRP